MSNETSWTISDGANSHCYDLCIKTEGGGVAFTDEDSADLIAAAPELLAALKAIVNLPFFENFDRAKTLITKVEHRTVTREMYGHQGIDEIVWFDITPLAFSRVGSRITCFPPPMDTDEDHLILVAPNDLAEAIGTLHEEGFKLDNPAAHYRPEEGLFNSWRKGVNLILTPSKAFYEKFLSATKIAKDRNLMEKADRIALFQFVLYGKGDNKWGI